MISVIKILQPWCRMHSWSKWENSLGDVALRRQEFQTEHHLCATHLCAKAWLVILLWEIVHQLQSSTALVQDNVLNHLHFADNEALLRGNSAKMQIKKKRVSSFVKQNEQLLISDDEINLMGNTSNF